MHHHIPTSSVAYKQRSLEVERRDVPRVAVQRKQLRARPQVPAPHTPINGGRHELRVVCLHRDDGYIVAGDMVAGKGTIVLDPPEGNLADYLFQLDRLRDLDSATLLPAHGPELSDPRAYLTHYIDHRNSRSDQVFSALSGVDGPTQPGALVPIIYPDIPTFIHPIAARQVLCHLQWLAGQGAVTRGPEGYQVST